MISLRMGAEGCAPIRVTEMAAAALAKRTAWPNVWPSVSATASAPLNTSPAPVVSIAFTANPGMRCVPCALVMRAPLLQA